MLVRARYRSPPRGHASSKKTKKKTRGKVFSRQQTRNASFPGFRCQSPSRFHRSLCSVLLRCARHGYHHGGSRPIDKTLGATSKGPQTLNPTRSTSQERLVRFATSARPAVLNRSLTNEHSGTTTAGLRRMASPYSHACSPSAAETNGTSPCSLPEAEASACGLRKTTRPRLP